ncbi:MAG: cytochrome P460 family protein, partial [Alphaproteobacteria bacterium]|nr:cytochrome P460 family protein [Alphaproteobacteria bacterium]
MGSSFVREIGRTAFALAALTMVAQTALAQDNSCPAHKAEKLVAKDPQMCALLDATVRAPGKLPLAEYEAKLGEYLGAFCHRNADAGWVRDKRLRDTGPFVSTLVDGEWIGSDHGVHAPVVIWYSPEAIAWIRQNRAAGDEGPGPDASPVPDGAMIIKEMYPAPADRCSSHDPLELLPTSGAAVMIRDSGASHDGWFWGWFGWEGEGWAPDWPANQQANGYPLMGFGQYCVNCHASARDNLTFSSAKNIQGEPGVPLAYLSQDEAWRDPLPAHHVARAKPKTDAADGDTPLKE